MSDLMFNERTGVEFPIESEYDTDARKSDRVKMLLDPNYRPTVVDPIGSEAHLEEKTFNYQYGTSLSREFVELLDDDPVADAMGVGWNLTLPDFLQFDIDETGEFEERGGTVFPVILKGFPFSIDGEEYACLIIRLPFTAQLEKGYTLLVKEPAIWNSQEYGNPNITNNMTVLTYLTHLNEAPHFIDIPILFEPGNSYMLPHGLSIAQIIPLHYNHMKPPMEIHDLASEEDENETTSE